jgi:hypothetical protein
MNTVMSILVSFCSVVSNPVAARSKMLVCGHWLAGIKGSNPAGGMNSVSCVICCQAGLFGQRSPTECGVFESDLVISTMRMPRPSSSVEPCGYIADTCCSL